MDILSLMVLNAAAISESTRAKPSLFATVPRWSRPQLEGESDTTVIGCICIALVQARTVVYCSVRRKQDRPEQWSKQQEFGIRGSGFDRNRSKSRVRRHSRPFSSVRSRVFCMTNPEIVFRKMPQIRPQDLPRKRAEQHTDMMSP
jgi:hypothetical protein